MTEVAKRIILDVDVGTDDAMAILIFLYAMKLGMLKIEAIVCTRGNTERENVVKNVMRMLEVTGFTDIPVYRGAVEPMIPPTQKVGYGGADGFGDVSWRTQPDISIVKDTPGPLAMYNLVKNNRKEITIIGLAALTNIALANRLYDDFLENVKEMWIMGGNYKGIGNVVGTSEYNFYIDPEAAHSLLNDTKANKPVNLLPWEACESSPIPLDWRFNVLGKSKLPAMQLLTTAERKVHVGTEKRWICCDGLLAAAYLFPQSTIKKQSNYSIGVELHGSETRGQVTLKEVEKGIVNAKIIEEVDFEFFKKLVLAVGEVLS